MRLILPPINKKEALDVVTLALTPDRLQHHLDTLRSSNGIGVPSVQTLVQWFVSRAGHPFAPFVSERGSDAEGRQSPSSPSVSSKIRTPSQFHFLDLTLLVVSEVPIQSLGYKKCVTHFDTLLVRRGAWLCQGTEKSTVGLNLTRVACFVLWRLEQSNRTSASPISSPHSSTSRSPSPPPSPETNSTFTLFPLEQPALVSVLRILQSNETTYTDCTELYDICAHLARFLLRFPDFTTEIELPSGTEYLQRALKHASGLDDKKIITEYQPHTLRALLSVHDRSQRKLSPTSQQAYLPSRLFLLFSACAQANAVEDNAFVQALAAVRCVLLDDTIARVEQAQDATAPNSHLAPLTRRMLLTWCTRVEMQNRESVSFECVRSLAHHIRLWEVLHQAMLRGVEHVSISELDSAISNTDDAIFECAAYVVGKLPPELVESTLSPLFECIVQAVSVNSEFVEHLLRDYPLLVTDVRFRALSEPLTASTLPLPGDWSESCVALLQKQCVVAAHADDIHHSKLSRLLLEQSDNNCDIEEIGGEVQAIVKEEVVSCAEVEVLLLSVLSRGHVELCIKLCHILERKMKNTPLDDDKPCSLRWNIRLCLGLCSMTRAAVRWLHMVQVQEHGLSRTAANGGLSQAQLRTQVLKTLEGVLSQLLEFMASYSQPQQPHNRVALPRVCLPFLSFLVPLLSGVLTSVSVAQDPSSSFSSFLPESLLPLRLYHLCLDLSSSDMPQHERLFRNPRTAQHFLLEILALLCREHVGECEAGERSHSWTLEEGVNVSKLVFNDAFDQDSSSVSPPSMSPFFRASACCLLLMHISFIQGRSPDVIMWFQRSLIHASRVDGGVPWQLSRLSCAVLHLPLAIDSFLTLREPLMAMCLSQFLPLSNQSSRATPYSPKPCRDYRRLFTAATDLLPQVVTRLHLLQFVWDLAFLEFLFYLVSAAQRKRSLRNDIKKSDITTAASHVSQAMTCLTPLVPLSGQQDHSGEPEGIVLRKSALVQFLVTPSAVPVWRVRSQCDAASERRPGC